MSRTGRGKTHRGNHAAVPDALYDRPAVAVEAGDETTVRFAGDDGRTANFSTTALVLPGWHAAVAAAFGQRVGPAGTRRTLASANATWTLMARFLRFLSGLPHPPETPSALLAAHIDAYIRDRLRTVGPGGWEELRDLRLLLEQPAIQPLVSDRVHRYLQRPVIKNRARLPRRSGYSDAELARVMHAARSDVASIRDRIEAGERLLDTVQDHAELHAHEADVAERLAVIARTGAVPRLGGLGERTARTELARRLFVTRADREPLLLLLAAVTGRNCETLKELPAEHRILDGVAVEVQLTKRRRGPRRWFDTVTWEIGPPHRQLHTPGGLYLLLHRLMARSRAVSGSQSLWSIWRNSLGELGSPAEHHDPYAAKLSASLELKQWAARHGLQADAAGSQGGGPLDVRFSRLRTAVEVRRTRAAGGHLPSAARSNTVGVLFSNYLRGDVTVQDWADDVIGEALADAEKAALGAHRAALAGSGHARLSVLADEPAPGGVHDGAWGSCRDPEQHPTTGRACRRLSYLGCLHCGNCLVTRTHLPAIVALADDLAQRRHRLGEEQWWQRYGPAWAAIHADILPRFTPAEVQAAQACPPADALLELAEDPWERL